MAQTQNIQWFPGHMAKTRRLIKETLNIVDAVAEIVDARIPLSSRNPELHSIIADKPRIVLLNKCDMADQRVTDQWIEHYAKQNIPAIAVDCRTGRGLDKFKTVTKETLAHKLEYYKNKGMVGRGLRIMVVGIPNVGKSSFINKMAGNNRAKAENRPGVTRGNQWFRIDKDLELLDTPGVLWPKFDDQTVGERLAFTGAVTDRILDVELLAVRLLEILMQEYPELLSARYGELDFEVEPYELLEQIGRRRGFLQRGNAINTERAANMLLEEYRNCKIGRITLERV
ncbi:MAG: ribosome biogenesis GTPase YlqF [Ruminococcaceae bacterium]|nr:ribosome biogenesis GTPase YlqF [Oscillospiraceae bacterium]